jgi:hypothetical protein
MPQYGICCSFSLSGMLRPIGRAIAQTISATEVVRWYEVTNSFGGNPVASICL